MFKFFASAVVCFMCAVGLFFAIYNDGHPIPAGIVALLFGLVGLGGIFGAGVHFGKGRLRWPEDGAIYRVESNVIVSNGHLGDEVVLLLKELKPVGKGPVIRVGDEKSQLEYQLTETSTPPLYYTNGNCAYGGHTFIRRNGNTWRKYPEHGVAIVLKPATENDVITAAVES
jgi:hypothetical protein